MNLNEKLEIVLITYNRREYLKTTLDEILADNSPVKTCDITVLNNASDDGTSELVEEYRISHPNLKHIINPKNIGGCANIAKAYSEFSSRKEYIWVLCDNDRYDWAKWNEIENAIENGFDLILTKNCPNNTSNIFYTTSLVSGAIYKCENITNTVIENMFFNVKYLFPHLALSAYIINHDKKVFSVSRDIVIEGINPNHDKTFVRGIDVCDSTEERKHLFWSVGFFNTLKYIKNRKTQIEIIEGLRHHHKTLFDLFKSIMVKNKIFHKNYFDNLKQIYKILSFKQKIKFIFAFLIINFSFKNYSFYEMRDKDDWIKYLEKIGEKEFLKKLSKKLKNKKILLYGAGMVLDILIENYDLSEFNIIGVSDKKFETIEKDLIEYKGLKVIKPKDIKNTDFDTILFSLKLYKRIAEALREQNINKEMLSLIKKDSKYIVRS